METGLLLNQRRLAAAGDGKYEHVLEQVSWEPRHTAAVLCDMWDSHWCKGAARRVGEMAPRMNEVIKRLRELGVLIIHSPSETMGYYEDHPARKNVLHLTYDGPLRAKLDREEVSERLPIDDSDGGCGCEPRCSDGKWTKQHEALDIDPEDALTDDANIFRLLESRGIRNVIIMGVHTNMCILNRPFAIRQLRRYGYNVVLMRDLTDSMYNPAMRPQVDHFTGTDLIVWHIEKHDCPTITSDQIIGGVPFRFKEDIRAVQPTFKNYVRIPCDDHHWIKVQSFIEETPHPDYDQASEEAREAFRDMKYGIRIHWGLYSMLHLNGESWPLLQMSNEERQSYQQLFLTFRPTGFSAQEWMRFFAEAGMRCMAITTKHHEGFSMFDTKTRVKRRVNWTAPGGPAIEDCDLSYSVMETPYGKDIIRELCDEARKRGIKIDLYFSHPDWYDASFRPYNYHPLSTPDAENLLIPGEPEEVASTQKRSVTVGPSLSEEETAHMLERHRAQLTELLTNYGKIDMMCLDQWMGPKIWPHMRETMKQLRSIQPDVMFRGRGIGNYGDYYTPEGFVPGSKENTDMPWMVIDGLGSTFSYDEEGSNYKGAKWVIDRLVDTVSKGGNFMIGIGPNREGVFHPAAIAQLLEVGDWLKRNGEAIYSTRPLEGDSYRQGSDIRYTRSKDGRTIYVLCLQWPGNQLVMEHLPFAEDYRIQLLDRQGDLLWMRTEAGLALDVAGLAPSVAKQHAYAFRVQLLGK